MVLLSLAGRLITARAADALVGQVHGDSPGDTSVAREVGQVTSGAT